MRRLNSFLLILLTLWLPVQAAASWTMPFCRHADARAADQQRDAAMQAPAHCHEQGEAAADRTMGEQGACDNCGACHLATAGYLPVTATNLAPAVASILVALPVPALPDRIGDPPQHPPRRTS